MENARKQIRKNLSEIKEFTNISEREFKRIFEKVAAEHLKDFLSEYNFEHSQSFEQFIATNDHQQLINWIFTKEI